ncbi:MAG: family efflux transporter permease subunit [Chloroflexi bacterium]|nr:family efflux transporter permease subunit [Chloroflexota bacterium]
MQPVQHRDNYRWWVLVTVVFGAFASILDSTIVNTALPRIQLDFGADLHLASYVVTAYILAAGVVVPATGYLANRFGSKRVYVTSLTLFTIGSALCGIAPNIYLLIAFRVLQGAGGAALFPLSFSMLFAAFPAEERGKANGIFGIPVLAAPALGPSLGGFLTQYADWRWVFYVNLPVGIVGVFLAVRVLRESTTQANRRFDLSGFLLAAGGLGLLLYGLSNLAFDGVGNVATVSGPIVVSIVLLAAFIPVELRKNTPLLDLRLYLRRNYTLATLVISVGVVGLFGPGFLLPQYLQGLRGQTPFEAGLLLLWQGLGAVVGTITSGLVYNRIGPRKLIMTGLVIITATSVLIAIWTTATSNLLLLPAILLVRGFGLPLTLQSTNTVALEGIRGPVLAEATTLNVVTRNVVASLTIALLTNYLQSRATYHLSALGKGVASTFRNVSGAMSHVSPPVLDAIAKAYQDTFILTAVIMLPSFVVAWYMRPASGTNVTAGQTPIATTPDTIAAQSPPASARSQ